MTVKVICGLFVLGLAACCQDLTQEEALQTVQAVYRSQEVAYYKAPVDATLVPPMAVETLLVPVTVHIIDADADAKFVEPVMPATLAHSKTVMRIPNPHAAVPGGPPPLVPCQGVCVTYSSQGDAAINALTGKKLTDFQAIEALVCATHPAQVPTGLILQMANAIGIETIQSKVGSAIVQQRVGLNWRSIILNSTRYGSMIALGFMTSGIWKVGVAAMFATATLHEASDDLPKLLSPGAPNPDPFLSNVLDGGGSLSVSPTNCQDVLFSGVYSGPSTSFVTAPIQIMP